MVGDVSEHRRLRPCCPKTLENHGPHRGINHLDEDSGVDAALGDDQLRAKWRKGWHMRLDAIKAGFAAERARPAVSSISQDDQ